MTARSPSVVTRRSQLWPTTRYLVRHALTPLVWTAGVIAALAALVWLLAVVQGWEYEVVDEGVYFGVEATRDLVTVQGPVGPAAMAALQLIVALAITAVVMAAVVPARHTRVLISSGVTRRSVSIGLLLALLAVVAVVTVAVLVLIALGGLDGLRPGGAVSTTEAWQAAASGLLQLGAAVLLVGAATTLFLRWPWWVGVAAGIALGLVLMAVGLLLPSLEDGWWWAAFVAVASAAAIVLVLRRVPTR
ncbi:hypothetical protein JNO54_00470 [Janibacter sp. YIM B02568]|uniref:hypothetical protein n=1 Tax=Janibacter endophyticus TaxID=2806261 RepID=UPI00194EB6C3|nr:hypothetical protein [Janibacter endophyticus]MBM6544619.1 hypothetical protein [Janibacter endophyticus]